MKQEHKQLLLKLVKEKRFPLAKQNVTDTEQNLINDIISLYSKPEIRKVMREAINKEVLRK